MNTKQINKTIEQLESLGYYEGDWEVSTGQKHNGFDWVDEPCISLIDNNGFGEMIKDDYKRNCDRLAGTEIITRVLGYYII